MADPLHLFDDNLEAADLWVRQVIRQMETDDPALAFRALRAVLHALRDRLPIDEVIDLAAQLPTIITGVLFQGFRRREVPERLDRAEFLERVRQSMGPDGAAADAERLAVAVLRVLFRQISRGEARDLETNVAQDLKPLSARLAGDPGAARPG